MDTTEFLSMQINTVLFGLLGGFILAAFGPALNLIGYEMKNLNEPSDKPIKVSMIIFLLSIAIWLTFSMKGFLIDLFKALLKYEPNGMTKNLLFISSALIIGITFSYSYFYEKRKNYDKKLLKIILILLILLGIIQFIFFFSKPERTYIEAFFLSELFLIIIITSTTVVKFASRFFDFRGIEKEN